MTLPKVHPNALRCWEKDGGVLFLDGILVPSADRSYKFTVGSHVKVEPQNPRKLKHRGRTGVLTGKHDDGDWHLKAQIKFDGTGRCGYVEVRDLVPFDGD